VLTCRIGIDCAGTMIEHCFAVGNCGMVMVVSTVNEPDDLDKSSAKDRVASSEQLVLMFV